MEEGNGHSTVWGRLASVEDAYLKLLAERDTAILERDKARAALVPLLEQVEKLRETLVAQLPKRETRLPSARTAYHVTPEMVDRWAELYESGLSVTKIAQKGKVQADTVKIHLEKRGIKIEGKRPFGHGARVPRCVECNLPLDSPALTQGNVPAPVDGVCGLCQFIGADLAERRAKAKEGDGNGR